MIGNNLTSGSNILDDANVLLFTRSMGLGGTERVVLQLAENLVGLVRSVTVASCGGKNVDYLSKLGIEHVELPDISRKTPSAAYSILHRLTEIKRSRNISIVHCHHRMAAFYSQLVFPGYPKMATAHLVFEDKRQLTRFAYRDMRVVACGHMVEKSLHEVYGLDRAQTVTIANSVPPFELDELSDIPWIWGKAGSLKLIYAGRLVEEKGLKYLLEALEIVNRHGIEFELAILGTGPDEPFLMELAEDLGILSRVHFLGYCEDVRPYLATADLCVLPSLMEGLPMIIIESLSVGTPVLGTQVGGTPEVISDGRNGLIVGPGDSYALATSIISVGEELPVLQEMRRNALNCYRTSYDYANWFARYRAEYEKCLMERS